MALGNFDRCFRLTLKHEGGYVDHLRDPGGATNLGITIGTLSGWIGRPATKAEVRSLTVDKVAPIYRKNYWDAARCDELPAGVDYAVYDFSVNSGLKRGVMALQRAVGVADDGKLGPITVAAVLRCEPSVVALAICDDRMAFLRKLSIWPDFGRGWTTRVDGVRVEALKMAVAAPPAVVMSDVKVSMPVIPVVQAPEPAPLPANPEPVPPPSGGWFSGVLARWSERYPYKGN